MAASTAPWISQSPAVASSTGSARHDFRLTFPASTARSSTPSCFAFSHACTMIVPATTRGASIRVCVCPLMITSMPGTAFASSSSSDFSGSSHSPECEMQTTRSTFSCSRSRLTISFATSAAGRNVTGEANGATSAALPPITANSPTFRPPASITACRFTSPRSKACWRLSSSALFASKTALENTTSGRPPRSYADERIRARPSGMRSNSWLPSPTAS